MPFDIVLSTEVAYRTDFSLLCNARGIKHAVEVGVEYGVFAADFLSRWEGETLLLVDDYGEHPEHTGGRLGDMMMACQAVAPYNGRVRWLQMSSAHAVANVPHWVTPRFIYLDACHEYADVKMDLELWWELLAPGNLTTPSEPGKADYPILAGHDYDDSHPGVIQAVNEFAEERGLVVRLVDRDSPVSWYIYPVEPPTLFRRYFDRQDDCPNPCYQLPSLDR